MVDPCNFISTEFRQHIWAFRSSFQDGSMSKWWWSLLQVAEELRQVESCAVTWYNQERLILFIVSKVDLVKDCIFKELQKHLLAMPCFVTYCWLIDDNLPFTCHGCFNGLIYVLKSNSGGKYRTFTTEDAVKSSPAVDPTTGLIYVGSHDQHAYALDIYVRIHFITVYHKHRNGRDCYVLCVWEQELVIAQA